MTEPLEREELIALLNTLGSEDDAEVLAAARDLHGRVEAAETTWDALIAPDGQGWESEDALDEADEFLPEAEEEEEARSPEEQDAANAEALGLIAKLLARPDASEALREELEGYKADIAEDEFTAADLRYLRALAARLGK